MYLKSLIEEAQKVLEENGDIPVTVFTSYGDNDEAAMNTVVEWLDKEGYAVFNDDKDKQTKVFCIYSGGEKITC